MIKILEFIKEWRTRRRVVKLMACGKPITGWGYKECANLYDKVLKR